MVSHRFRSIAGSVTLACALFAASPALAGTGKTYEVAISAPHPLTAGTRASLTVTVKNTASPQELGSANVPVPAPLVGIAAAGGAPGQVTWVASGGRVELRNLALPPGSTFTFSLTVDVPCAAGSATWNGITVKQANNFSGPPGNDFDPAPPPRTSWTEACRLEFVAQPHAALVGETISDRDFVRVGAGTPPAGPVTMRVVGASGQTVTSASGTVTTTLTVGSSNASVLAGTTSTALENGVARFTGLTISAPGTYRLHAAGAGMASDPDSDPFTVSPPGVVCQAGQPCTLTKPLPSLASFYTVTSATGAASVLTLDYLGDIGCAGYTAITPAGSTATVNVTATNRAKQVSLTIKKTDRLALPSNGVGGMQMCFARPTSFLTRSGTQAAPANTNGNVGPNGWYVGLLPDCGVPPCVRARQSLGGGDVRIVADAPAGDPRFRG